MGWGAADGVWTLPVGYFYSFFSQFVTANVDTVEGSPVSFWATSLAPSPGLPWYDSYTAGPRLFPLNADLYFSQAKGGVPNTILYQNAEDGDELYLFWGIPNEWT